MEKKKKGRMRHRLSLFVVALLSCLAFASCGLAFGGLPSPATENGMGAVSSGARTATNTIGGNAQYSGEYDVYEFAYSGGIQSLNGLTQGMEVQLEVWGARGGWSRTNAGNFKPLMGGNGGYSYGKLKIPADNSTLWVNVGGRGGNAYGAGSDGSITIAGSYGGAGGGGGATDMRLNGTSLSQFVIVAGGGGGNGGDTNIANTGHGGGGVNPGADGPNPGTAPKGGNESIGGTGATRASYENGGKGGNAGQPGGAGAGNNTYTYAAGGGGGAGMGGGGGSLSAGAINTANRGSSGTTTSGGAGATSGGGGGGGGNYGIIPGTATSAGGLGNSGDARANGGGGYGGGGGAGGNNSGYGCHPGGGGGGYAGGGGNTTCPGGAGGSGYIGGVTDGGGSTGGASAVNVQQAGHGYARITILTQPPVQDSVPTFEAARGQSYPALAVDGKKISNLNVEDKNAATSSIKYANLGIFTEMNTSSLASEYLEWNAAENSIHGIKAKTIFTNKPFYVLVENNLGVQAWVQFNLTYITC